MSIGDASPGIFAGMFTGSLVQFSLPTKPFQIRDHFVDKNVIIEYDTGYQEGPVVI